MSERLVMTFGTTLGNKTSLSVYDPKDDLDEDTVTEAMQSIIDADIFTSNGGDLTAIDSAKIVTTTTTTII